MNLLIPNKKTLYLIVGLVLVIIILTVVTLSSTGNPPVPTTAPTPSVDRINPNNLPTSSSEFIFPNQQESIYSPEDLKKDYQRIVEKKPLSTTDADIRTGFIASLEGQTGYLQQTPNYKIEYVRAPNIFMIEILSEDVESAKSEALAWFTGKGLSTQGICNLPVSIYTSPEVSDSLRSQDKTFNPNPEGCQ